MKIEKESEKKAIGILLNNNVNKSYILIVSIDDLQKQLQTQFRISRMKGLEIEDLKATVRAKEDKIICKYTVTGEFILL